ncbi:MAG: hypothetical protein E6J43_13665 [Chloroflexi bacterium]|nr:MAG: hypothetical protein E6J43_13665 [Chloroflexota bacterium]
MRSFAGELGAALIPVLKAAATSAFDRGVKERSQLRDAGEAAEPSGASGRRRGGRARAISV